MVGNIFYRYIHTRHYRHFIYIIKNIGTLLYRNISNNIIRVSKQKRVETA